MKLKVFAEESNKIALSSNDDKRMKSIDLIETYVYGTSEDLVSDKKEINCNNTIKRYKSDKLLWCHRRRTKEHNPNWSQSPDHPYRILIIGGCKCGKTNSLFNLIDQQPDFDKTYLYAKDPYKAK